MPRIAARAGAHESGIRAKSLAFHASTVATLGVRSTQDRARDAQVKVRSLCCKCSEAGLKHERIAEEIGVRPRTLSSYKSGVQVPHVVVEALESLVQRVARKVGPDV